jgi:hypothetical protein
LNNRFVKVADFGLAVIDEHSKQSHIINRGIVKVVSGTKYNTKAHIFSLGKITQNLFNILLILSIRQQILNI